MGKIRASKLTQIPREFIVEVATGLEDGKDIAERYGFTEEEWTIVEAYKPFQVEVAKLKSEMEKSGQSFRLKAGVMSDVLLDTLFKRALKDDSQMKDQLETLKVLAKLGDLEPKNTAAANAGTGFSITINLPEGTKTIEAEKVIEEVEEVEEVQYDRNNPFTVTFSDSDAKE